MLILRTLRTMFYLVGGVLLWYSLIIFIPIGTGLGTLILSCNYFGCHDPNNENAKGIAVMIGGGAGFFMMIFDLCLIWNIGKDKVTEYVADDDEEPQEPQYYVPPRRTWREGPPLLSERADPPRLDEPPRRLDPPYGDWQ